MYQTQEDILAYKDKLRKQIDESEKRIARQWRVISTPPATTTRAEKVSNMIASALTAYDAFMLFRRLTSTYHSIFSRKKKHKS